MDIHVYHHIASDPKLDQILHHLSALAAQVDTMNADTQAALDQLNAEVTRDTNLTESIKTTLEGMAAQIEALGQGSNDPAVLAALRSAAEIVRANNDKTAKAITDNTPGQ